MKATYSSYYDYLDAPVKERAFIAENKERFFPALSETGNARLRYVPHKPYDEKKLRMTETYLMMFRQAKKYIFWGCHGIRPPRIMADNIWHYLSISDRHFIILRQKKDHWECLGSINTATKVE